MEEESDYMKRIDEHMIPKTKQDEQGERGLQGETGATDMTDPHSFDPEKLVLTKPEILEFCDRVLKKWEKNPTNNENNIFAMNGVKLSVIWTDEESLKAIWGEILAWTFDLLYKNAVSLHEEELVDVIKKIKEKGLLVK
jgi:hypothetical protein